MTTQHPTPIPNEDRFIAAFRAFLGQHGLAESSIKVYVRRALSILRSKQTPAAWLHTKTRHGAPKGTVVSYRATARYLWAFLRGVSPKLAGDEPHVEVRKVANKVQLHMADALDPARLEQYLAAVQADPDISPEARCILQLLPFTGLRISEAVNLRKADVVKPSNIPSLRVVRGKGGKERMIPLGKRARVLLGGYAKKHRTTGPWLFPSPQDPRQHISDSGIRHHHERVRIRLGAGWEKTRLHDLRHTFASRLIEQGVNIEAVRDLLGHESTRTTEVYVHSNVTALKRFVDDL